MEWVALCSATCSGFGGTGELRPADMLGSEISGTQLGNYSLMGCEVVHVCS
jgi:uncharacterized ParB-like nuclease family protein